MDYLPYTKERMEADARVLVRVIRSCFWKMVQKSPEPDGCWTWAGRKWRNGYGRTEMVPGEWSAHRAAWVVSNGTIPEGKHVLHRCDNPPCVRPDHLFVGTAKDNAQDRDAKGRGRKGRKFSL
jgi:HNH endonuclease